MFLFNRLEVRNKMAFFKPVFQICQKSVISWVGNFGPSHVWFSRLDKLFQMSKKQQQWLLFNG